jgi:hypothetical protein
LKTAGLLLTLVLTSPAYAADDAARAANDFYAVYGSQHGGGIPDAGGRARYAPLLSPRLNKQLAAAAAAEIRFAAKVKGAAPPLIEGDLFTSLFEGATAWKVGPCSDDGKTARCPASLGHVEKTAKPTNWNDTLVLANTPSGWKVDDVIYDAGFAFGNTGRLSDTLTMVIAQSPP